MVFVTSQTLLFRLALAILLGTGSDSEFQISFFTSFHEFLCNKKQVLFVVKNKCIGKFEKNFVNIMISNSEKFQTLLSINYWYFLKKYFPVLEINWLIDDHQLTYCMNLIFDVFFQCWSCLSPQKTRGWWHSNQCCLKTP